jgi:hypothetical protein
MLESFKGSAPKNIRGAELAEDGRLLEGEQEEQFAELGSRGNGDERFLYGDGYEIGIPLVDSTKTGAGMNNDDLVIVEKLG